MLYEAYEHFNDLLRKFPHHGFSPQQRVHIFYNGLTLPCMNHVDGAANGCVLNQFPEDALQILEDLTTNSYRAHERVVIRRPVVKKDYEQ